MILRGPDGHVHYSTLKEIGRSPAHYKHRIEFGFEGTRATRIGQVCHNLVLGPNPHHPIVLWSGGKRAGNSYLEFAAANKDKEIITQSEWDDGEQMAKAVMSHELASSVLFNCEKETPLTWEEDGIHFATSGIDFLRVADYFGDLKTTSDAEPDAYMRHVMKMRYLEQLALYRRGLRAAKIAVPNGAYHVVVESKAPFPVTVIHFNPRDIDYADIQVETMLTKLRACEKANHWPGYSETVVKFQMPAWLAGEDDSDEEGDEVA